MRNTIILIAVTIITSSSTVIAQPDTESTVKVLSVLQF